MRVLCHDIRYSIRLLLKTPVATLTAILLLGLCIGANSAVFSLVNALLLRPLPLSDPARLVSVARVGPDVRNPRGEGLTLPMLAELGRSQRVFSGIAAWGSGLVNFEVAILSAGAVIASSVPAYRAVGVNL